MFSGAGNQGFCLSESLSKKGVEIIIITGKFGLGPIKEKNGTSLIYRVPIIKKCRWLSCSISTCYYMIITRHMYDIVHIHGALDRSLEILTAKLLRKKLVIKMTLYGCDDPLAIRESGRLGRLRLKVFSLGDIFVSISTVLTEAFRKVLPRKPVRYIPNGVDVTRFRPISNDMEKRLLRKDLGLPVGVPMAMSISRICRRKGVDTLIDAWKDIVFGRPEAVLLLVGPTGKRDYEDEEFFEQLQKKVKEHGLIGNIIFTDTVGIGHVHKYLMASDLFIFASRQEGLPTAIIEAMACGLPPIVMNIPGVSEDIVSNGIDGIIIYDYNIREFVSVISGILGEPQQYKSMGGEARGKAVKEFSIEKIADRYLKLYEELGK
ncbi:glycosyltransferase family 4 protein [Candidatus Omnitrophota bacterium]